MADFAAKATSATPVGASRPERAAAAAATAATAVATAAAADAARQIRSSFLGGSVHPIMPYIDTVAVYIAHLR